MCEATWYLSFYSYFNLCLLRMIRNSWVKKWPIIHRLSQKSDRLYTGWAKKVTDYIPAEPKKWPIIYRLSQKKWPIIYRLSQKSDRLYTGWAKKVTDYIPTEPKKWPIIYRLNQKKGPIIYRLSWVWFPSDGNFSIFSPPNGKSRVPFALSTKERGSTTTWLWPFAIVTLRG